MTTIDENRGNKTTYCAEAQQFNAGQALLTTAPADYAPPAGLPPMLLLAGLAGADTNDAPGAGGFVLTIASPALTGLFQIWGSKPTLADKVLRPAHDFTLLGTLPGLTVQADISTLYAAKFDAPAPGAKVAVQVVAVSPEGFKDAPLLVTAVAQFVGLAKPSQGDKGLLKAA